MQQTLHLTLRPSESSDEELIRRRIAEESGLKPSQVSGYHILRRSLDARTGQARILLTVNAFIDEPFHPHTITPFYFRDVSKALHSVIIIGAGPAGLFAALKLLEQGIRPLILERGKDVRARRRDLAALNKEGVVHPESNYCFGEGGAGTYSDGKLYTRSSKRGDVNRILNLFVKFGAAESILVDAHPHIGTNKLPQIITAMRMQIEACGGGILFEKKVTGLTLVNEKISSVQTADGSMFTADAVILATGHSARDIFYLLHRQKIAVQIKSFALGVRIEHPQELIDTIQYHRSGLFSPLPAASRPPYLPPASYSLVEQVAQKGVFSFCMCPGGIIAPAATAHGEIVVNGWSPSKRDNPFANSGIVVSIEEKDMQAFHKEGPLAGLCFQQSVEQTAFRYGGGKMVAPAQRMVDFTEQKNSASLPSCSYLPGIHAAPVQEVLPDFVAESLRKAFVAFGKKMKGYYTNEAVIVATESRTSSPVRIPRDKDTLQHPQVENLYPCGEGAGYAGGIISAAMDGERVATRIAAVLQH